MRVLPLLCSLLLFAAALPADVDAQFLHALALGADRAPAPLLRPAQLPPDVLHPDPSRWWIGPQIGVNLNTHPGTFRPYCDECSFSDGSGAGVLLGLQLEHAVAPAVHVTAKLLYDNKSADYTALTPQRLSDVKVVETGEYVQEYVNYERSSSVVLSYLMLHLAAQVYPFGGFYVFAGPAVGIPLDATYNVREKIMDPGYVYPRTDLTEEDIEPVTNLDRVTTLESPRLDLRAGIGYDLPIGRSVLLSPEVSYGLPLTDIASFSGWKAETIHLVVVLKFAL